MWEWIFKEAKAAARTAIRCQSGGVKLEGYDIDDIVNEICYRILSVKGMAEQIYSNKKKKVIYGIARKVIFEKKADMFFSSDGKGKKAFSDYCLILRICNDYNIEPVPENAYKIQAILENKYNKKIKNSKSTRGIVALFEEVKPFLRYYGE